MSWTIWKLQNSILTKLPYDKAAHYAVFGGSPFVNQALNPEATIRENIISTILNPMSAVYLYASQLLLSDYSVKINAERIFSVIGNGRSGIQKSRINWMSKDRQSF